MWLKFRITMLVMFYLIKRVPSRLIEVKDKEFEKYVAEVDKMSKKYDATNKVVEALGRQTLLQQLFVEERIRSDGDSGVKQVRLHIDGTRNYHSATHTGWSFISMHDHANNIRTVGMGEFIAVLNGVEFRTRHNDYRLYMPHRTKKDWHATEEIPFPEVPPQVLNKKDVNEQIKEMRAWFKAWKDQDYKVRDYRKYFKPVLCYLEGAWTTSTKGKIDEPFESDRHFVDASNWFDLQEKIRFTSYTGRKDNLENFSFLPTTIMKMTENGHPEFAQWNYRIMCHPLKTDLPLNRFRVVDELGLRLSSKKTIAQHSQSRAARFQLNTYDTDKWTDRKNYERWSLLDKLMSEIPGKDNYVGHLKDKAFGLTAYSNADPKHKNVELKADRYHRRFRVSRKGAMGTSLRHRGFSDQNVFMAMNSQPNVVGMDLTTCSYHGWPRKKVCKTINQKWSYAIPLEIIYLTPLSKWNPYSIQYKGNARSTLGKTVEAGGRNGGYTVKTAYNGTHSTKFYQTPVEFYLGGEVGKDSADTTRNTVGVLNKNGVVRKCKASGTRIFLPIIEGVGSVRQRFPIAPVHGEGSAVWKELEATKDALLYSRTNGYVFREPMHNGPIPTEPPRRDVQFQVNGSRKPPPNGPKVHVHYLTLTADQVDFVKRGGKYGVTTTEGSGHNHNIMVAAWKDTFYIWKCDGVVPSKGWLACPDQHPRSLIPMPN